MKRGDDDAVGFRGAWASTAELVECFGVTKAYLGKLAGEGKIAKAGRDRWDAFETVRRFTEMLRNRKVNQHDGRESERPGDFEAERTRKMKADADVAEIEAALLMGRVHEARAVEELWIGQVLTCRSRLLGLPSKLAAVAPAEFASEMLALATEVVREALNELADYSPQKIAERTDRRRLFDPARTEDDEAVEAAAEAEPEPMG